MLYRQSTLETGLDARLIRREHFRRCVAAETFPGSAVYPRQDRLGGPAAGTWQPTWHTFLKRYAVQN